jgi:hypothetical protein
MIERFATRVFPAVAKGPCSGKGSSREPAGSEEQKREILVLTEEVKSFPREEKHGQKI